MTARVERHAKETLLKNLKYAAGLLALIPACAFAQVADDQADMQEEPGTTPSAEIVVTATGQRQMIWTTGQAISVVERRDIERLQTTAASDLLAQLPGISATRNGPVGGFSAVRIRGAEGEQTLVVIDGVRVNDPVSPGGGFDFGNLLIGNIDRVEVLRGPNSVPWGSQALGGVVNITTGNHTDTRVTAEYGAHDTKRINAATRQQIGSVFFDLGGGVFQSDGISAFKNGTERDGLRQYALNGGAEVDGGKAVTLEARGFYANSRTQLDGFPPPFFGFADTPEFSRAEEFYGKLSADIRLLNGNFTNRLTFAITDINRDNFDAPGQAAPSFLARGRVERFEYQGDKSLASSLRTVFGVEHERSRLTDGFSPAKTSVSSGYAQLIYGESDRLTLTGGARIDDHKAYGTKATFSANAAFRPADGIIIRAAYGDGFKAPTLFQLFSFYGNASLNPETAKSVEIGVELSKFAKPVSGGITIFQRNTANQIDFISCFGQSTGICAGRPFGTYDNIARTRAKGLEAFARVRASDKLRFDANYTFISAKNRDTGLTLLRRPKHILNTSVDWAVFDQLTLGAALQFVSSTADVDFQTFARTRLSGRTLAMIRAAAPINDRIELFGRIENLLDTTYETVSGYGVYGRTAHIGIRGKF